MTRGLAEDDGREEGFGFDAQSFIEAYSADYCEMCGGDGHISDEGYVFGYPRQIICPACDGSCYQEKDEP